MLRITCFCSWIVPLSYFRSKVQTASSETKKSSALCNISNESATDFHNSFLSPVKDKNSEEFEIIEDSPVAVKQPNKIVKQERMSKIAPCKRKLDNDDLVGARKKVKNDEVSKKVLESAVKTELDGMEEDFDFGDDFNDDFEDIKLDVVDSGESDVEMPLAAKYNRHKVCLILFKKFNFNSCFPGVAILTINSTKKLRKSNMEVYFVYFICN